MAKTRRMRYEFRDDYEWIRIIDAFPDNHRSLHFEDSVQGVLDLNAHHDPVLEYIGLMAEGSRLFNLMPERVLIGGLGSGALLHTFTYWWERYADILTVETNERIVELARRFFRLRSRDKIEINDLRETLENAEAPYQVVAIDCYSATSIPPHLTTIEFMEHLANGLTSNGSAVFNLWSPSCNELCGDQIRTMLEVFDKVAVASCHEDQNLVVFVRRDARLEWPSSIEFKGKRYDLKMISKTFEKGWPEYMQDSDIITDENMGHFFSALALSI